MPTPTLFSVLSDRDLLEAVSRAAADERHATVHLIRLLAELDSRRLYLAEGCSSLFTFCTQVLHLSEHAAYHRIEAARAVRAFPVVIDFLVDGSLTLTTLALLRAHLTAENQHRLLEEARYKTKREVEDQIARLAPQPDVRPLVRQLPMSVAAEPPPALDLRTPATEEASQPEKPRESTGPAAARPAQVLVTPRSPGRYLLRVTISSETQAKLRQARDLLRHAIPDGDPAAILDRALTLLVQRLEREKSAITSRPRVSRSSQALTEPRSNARRISAAVRREVWVRDQGRCAFEGPHGRCHETGRLEFHHIVPFADGGSADPANISLRCRAHNSFESEQRFGPWSLT